MRAKGASMDKKRVFDSLDVSEEERKYIEIHDGGVSLRFPLEDASTDGAGARAGATFETGLPAQFQKIIAEFWEGGRGAVTFKARLGESSEAEFFKKAVTQEEIRDTVLVLVRLMRRLGILPK